MPPSHDWGAAGRQRPLALGLPPGQRSHEGDGERHGQEGGRGREELGVSGPDHRARFALAAGRTGEQPRPRGRGSRRPRRWAAACRPGWRWASPPSAWSRCGAGADATTAAAELRRELAVQRQHARALPANDADPLLEPPGPTPPGCAGTTDCPPLVCRWSRSSHQRPALRGPRASARLRVSSTNLFLPGIRRGNGSRDCHRYRYNHRTSCRRLDCHCSCTRWRTRPVRYQVGSGTENHRWRSLKRPPREQIRRTKLGTCWS